MKSVPAAAPENEDWEGADLSVFICRNFGKSVEEANALVERLIEKTLDGRDKLDVSRLDREIDRDLLDLLARDQYAGGKDAPTGRAHVFELLLDIALGRFGSPLRCQASHQGDMLIRRKDIQLAALELADTVFTELESLQLRAGIGPAQDTKGVPESKASMEAEWRDARGDDDGPIEPDVTPLGPAERLEIAMMLCSAGRGHVKLPSHIDPKGRDQLLTAMKGHPVAEMRMVSASPYTSESDLGPQLDLRDCKSLRVLRVKEPIPEGLIVEPPAVPLGEPPFRMYVGRDAWHFVDQEWRPGEPPDDGSSDDGSDPLSDLAALKTVMLLPAGAIGEEDRRSSRKALCEAAGRCVEYMLLLAPAGRETIWATFEELIEGLREMGDGRTLAALHKALLAAKASPEEGVMKRLQSLIEASKA